MEQTGTAFVELQKKAGSGLGLIVSGELIIYKVSYFLRESQTLITASHLWWGWIVLYLDFNIYMEDIEMKVDCRPMGLGLHKIIIYM